MVIWIDCVGYESYAGRETKCFSNQVKVLRRYSSRILGWPFLRNRWEHPGNLTNSTSFPSRLSVTKYCSLCSMGHLWSDSPCSRRIGVLTFWAYVRGDCRTNESKESYLVPAHCLSPKLTPMSDVPYMLDRSVHGAPTPAALTLLSCPTIQELINPP